MSGRASLLPLAACLARFKIEVLRQDYAPTIRVYGDQFGDRVSIFQSAWDFLKNARGTMPDGVQKKLKAGWEIGEVKGLKARQEKRVNFIEVDLRVLPSRNITFSVYDRNELPYAVNHEAAFITLFDYLIGRTTTSDLWGFIQEQKGGVNPVTPFKFANSSTRTTVIYRSPDGLPPHAIKCRLLEEQFTVPPEIESLIDEAHKVLQSDATVIRKMDDRIMFAPRRMEIRDVDLDTGAEQVEITFVHSSYRYYAAMAFAELLARFDHRFNPLFDFSRQSGDSNQPAPATCSMGVRVLVETQDKQLVVCHRSDSVKLNPNVWSVSANEGLRDSLLKPGHSAEDLLSFAVQRAMYNELRMLESEYHEPVLLSIYHNEFNQWGAGFFVKSDLSLQEIIQRQSKSHHHWEHRTLAGLPVKIDACGRAMRDLGPRWYGGALETICTALSWRELGSSNFVSPEEVAKELNRGAANGIIPVDEANSTMLPKSV